MPRKARVEYSGTIYHGVSRARGKAAILKSDAGTQEPTLNRYTNAFKAKVALEAMRGAKTIRQIAKENDIHPVQVSQWKKVIRDRMGEIFEPPQDARKAKEKEIAQLFKKIEKLTVEIDWLKRKSKQLGL